jgi:hypothetical protein
MQPNDYSDMSRVLLILAFGISQLKMQNCVGYTDSDWVGTLDDMKSTFDYTFFFLEMEYFHGFHKKQDMVAQSTWNLSALQHVQQQMKQYELEKFSSTCVKFNKNPLCCIVKASWQLQLPKIQSNTGKQSTSMKTKHINVKYHFLREAKGMSKISLIH